MCCASLGVVFEDFDAGDVRVHVRRDDDHVQVPVAVRVEIVAEIELGAGAAQEIRPEELAHRDPVRLSVLQRGDYALGFQTTITHANPCGTPLPFSPTIRPPAGS